MDYHMSIRLDKQTRNKLDKIDKIMGRGKSGTIRQIIREYRLK